MKPAQEQVIEWAREICGPNMAEWRDGTEMEWHEFHALALRCYEAGRKEEREWQGLTDEEIFAVENSVPDAVITDRDWCVHFARAVETKLKEKNT